MTSHASAVAIIPARGGSKGIPRKNLYPLAGKPLIGWAIEAAKGCPNIMRVVVSSDDDEILSVAESLGAKPLKRPDELASDTAGAKPVLQHALVELQKKDGSLPEWVVYLQPTSPLRTAEHLTGAFRMLEEHPEADALLSVYEIDSSYLKSSIVNESGYLEYAAKGEYANANRQSLPKLYMPNGAIYIMKSAACVKEPRFDGEKTLPFVMSAQDSLDLDSKEDVAACEAAFAARASA